MSVLVFLNLFNCRCLTCKSWDGRCKRLAQAKSSKMASMFLKEEKLCYKMVYYTLYST